MQFFCRVDPARGLAVGHGECCVVGADLRRLRQQWTELGLHLSMLQQGHRM
jgi:hypothetical protein